MDKLYRSFEKIDDIFQDWLIAFSDYENAFDTEYRAECTKLMRKETHTLLEKLVTIVSEIEAE